MTITTKLGDVAAYLRAGDLVRPKISACAMRIGEVSRAHGVWLAGEFFDHNTQVELLNPRWVPYYGPDSVRSVPDDAVMFAFDKVTTLQAFYADPRACDDAQVLCRETAGKLEPVRAGELPREVFADEIRVGDEFQRPEEPRVTWLAAEVNELRFRMKCVAISAPGVVSLGYVGSQCRRDQVKLVLLSRNNPIPSDTPQPDSLPRLVKGSELRVGDRMLFAAGGDVEEEDAERWNQDGGPFTVVRIDSLSGTRYVRSGKGEDFVCLLGWTVELLSRAEPTTEPPPALDTDRLRREWEYLAERTRWHALVDLAKVRHGADCKAEHLLDQATCAFEQALGSYAKGGSEPGRYGGFLVVLQPENLDRPIELYSLALNATAYHAKVAEIWPKPVAKTELRKACVTCGAMCGGSMIRCGDCLMAMDKRAGVLVGHVGRMHDPENRFRGLPPAPGVHLSPGALYHLQDDPDSTGIPGGHN